MNIPVSEYIAMVFSRLIAFHAMQFSLVILLYQIDEVDETVFPMIGAVILLYTGIGQLILLFKDINPQASKKIQDGKIDLEWGVKHFYWTLWWPKFSKQ